MLDILDLLEWVIDGCYFDIYDCDNGVTTETGLSREELENWCETHDYDLWSFEPSQREKAFAIVFNVGGVEEKENN